LVGIFSKHDMSKENFFAPLEVIEFFTSKVGKEFNIFVFKWEGSPIKYREMVKIRVKTVS
jgi:hypothetical protein